MMRKPIRSFLFVPGDSERKQEKALDSGADALILDLEDSVMPERKPQARDIVAAFLARFPIADRETELWVRVNPPGTPQFADDLAVVVAGNPNGVMLPKVDGPEDVAKVEAALDRSEDAAGIERGTIPLLPVATETAISPFRLGGYANAGLSRLYGLAWGAEDLATALGASTNVGRDGEWSFHYKLVRSLTLMGARAAGCEPVETIHVNIRDEEGLRLSSIGSRSEGFSGRLAIHPAQVPIINECFTPCDDEIAFARRIVELFDQTDAGTIGLDGKMIDIPHLNQARRTLALADLYQK